MGLEEFDYYLPRSLIAQYPLPQRGESRLMVLDRHQGTIQHHSFKDLIEFLRPGDLLVMNNTRVLPARLLGKKESGGKIELLLVPSWNGSGHQWEAIVKNLGKIKGKVQIQFGPSLFGELSDVRNGRGKITFPDGQSIEEILKERGRIPLPPYIKRKDEPLDRERYQTVFAERDGSIAAPTAGLHFTQQLINALKDRGIEIVYLTLHIGPGTFTPVKTNDIAQHQMDPEWVDIPEKTANKVAETKKAGKRVIAIGTTATRALEAFATSEGHVQPGRKQVSLYIFPPYQFKVVDGLVTNFHLPKSTLILLVSAFAGKEFILSAYREAIKEGYRFYSYGDAMLIL